MMTQTYYSIEKKENTYPSSHRVATVVGSRLNNSDKPYFESRYDRQRSSRSLEDYDIRSFVTNAIHSQRAVVFLKGTRSDALSKVIHKLFSENCDSEDIAFYHLDDVPTIGDDVRKFLAERFESTSTQNCFVFVRGTYVPLWHIQKVLAARTTTA